MTLKLKKGVVQKGKGGKRRRREAGWEEEEGEGGKSIYIIGTGILQMWLKNARPDGSNALDACTYTRTLYDKNHRNFTNTRPCTHTIGH